MTENHPPDSELKAVPPMVAGETPQAKLSSIDSEGPVVTRRELWSFYLYYNGDNGMAVSRFSLTIFQLLALQAGFDYKLGPGHPCDSSSAICVVHWLGGTKAVSSVVLVAIGIVFTIDAILFVVLGSLADYGNIGRWVILLMTVILWAFQLASIALVRPSQWHVAMAIWIISGICYTTSQTLFLANIPRLGRNTARTRAVRDRYQNGTATFQEYEQEESLEKNRIGNIVEVHRNAGTLVVLLLCLSILLPLKNHPLANNYTIILCNSYWIIIGIWWFIFQQPRPGIPVPGNALTLGIRQVWSAARNCRRLPNTFFYLIGQFLLSDGLNTTTILIFIIQNDTFQLSFLMSTYLGIVQAVSWILGGLISWYIQRYWKISTKKMLVFTTTGVLFVPIWGLFGLGTKKVGFHNSWEFWLFNVIFSWFQAPFWAYSQTAMSELSPPGYSNMFFGLYGVTSQSATIIGSNVLQAVINKTHNNSLGFPLCFALCLTGCSIIWFFVDIQEGKRDAVAWAEHQQSLSKDKV